MAITGAFATTEEVTSGQETIAKNAPREMKLMIASFGTINAQAEVEGWLGDMLKPGQNLEEPPTLSEADKVANPNLAACIVRANWNTKKLEYIRNSRDIQQENARRAKILTNLKTGMLSEPSQRYTALGRDYLTSSIHNQVGELIKIVDRGNIAIASVEKAIKGQSADVVNGADCILSVVLGDREKDTQEIPVDNVGTKIKRTTYTQPYVGKIRDLDGNILIAFDDKLEWKESQDNVVKNTKSDPARKLVKLVCDDIAKKVVNYFTTQLKFKIKIPKGMKNSDGEPVETDDVEVFVDGREVNNPTNGVRVLAFEHVVKGELEGCKPVSRVVQVERGETKDPIPLKFKKRPAEKAIPAEKEAE